MANAEPGQQKRLPSDMSHRLIVLIAAIETGRFDLVNQER